MPEQIVSFDKQDGTSVSLKGAYKHFNCNGFVLSDTDEATCFECRSIPNLKSFKKGSLSGQNVQKVKNEA